MTVAEARKTVASVLVSAAAIAGIGVSAGLFPPHIAVWVTLGIAIAGAVAHALAVFVVPNGKTLTERFASLESQLEPDATKIVDAVQLAPFPDTFKSEAEKFKELLKETGGVAARAPWPKEAPVVPSV